MLPALTALIALQYLDTRADAARLKALVRRQYDLAVPLSYESRPHSIGSIFVRRPGQPLRRFDPRLDLVDWSELADSNAPLEAAGAGGLDFTR